LPDVITIGLKEYVIGRFAASMLCQAMGGFIHPHYQVIGMAFRQDSGAVACAAKRVQNQRAGHALQCAAQQLKSFPAVSGYGLVVPVAEMAAYQLRQVFMHVLLIAVYPT